MTSKAKSAKGNLHFLCNYLCFGNTFNKSKFRGAGACFVRQSAFDEPGHLLRWRCMSPVS